MMKKILLVLAWLLPLHLLATVYYVDSEDGNDQLDGQSETSAWQTLNRVQQESLTAGDTVFLKRGQVFKETIEITGEGTFMQPILIATYGSGDKPVISAPDGSKYAVRIFNSSYVTLKNIEVVNHGVEELAGRTGILMESIDYGTSKSLKLQSVDIRDVNGSLVKDEGGGSGILIRSQGVSRPSNFDGLVIENCSIINCQRNGMIWDSHWQRDDRWFPNTNTVIRNNLIRGVPGDGIVPIGCENTLIEFNKMEQSPATLPDSEAAAGFWPWSCDNTTIQFNEVSDHKAPWDAQGFDSDYNCKNTTIQYNFSHDNDGGFLLICNSGEMTDQVGNVGTLVQFNLSVDDGVRSRPTRIGMFSPAIHISGPVHQTILFRNLIYAGKKPHRATHRSILVADSWGGFPNETKVLENVFVSLEPSLIDLQRSTSNQIDGNQFYGEFSGLDPFRSSNRLTDSHSVINQTWLEENLLIAKSVAEGKGTLRTVDPIAIERFFDDK